jgi:hypothetical protein
MFVQCNSHSQRDIIFRNKYYGEIVHYKWIYIVDTIFSFLEENIIVDLYTIYIVPTKLTDSTYQVSTGSISVALLACAWIGMAYIILTCTYHYQRLGQTRLHWELIRVSSCVASDSFWLAVRNAFPTRSYTVILLKSKHSSIFYG